MLKVFIPPAEYYDEAKNLFIEVEGAYLSLEHSLVSISKWEARHKKEFLTDTPKTREETIDDIRCMTLTQNVNPAVYRAIPDGVLSQVNEYIGDPMTATTFSDSRRNKKPGKKKKITSEVIYYYMFSLGIPKDCEKWHLNRLLTLIRIFQIENTPKKDKKMSYEDVIRQNKELNAARRKAMNTKG